MMWMKWVLSVAIVTGLCVGCGGKVSAPTDDPSTTSAVETPQVADPPADATPPAADGAAALLDKNCTACHSLDRVKNFDHEETWQVTVTRMIEKHNAAVSPEDAKSIVDYLNKTYPAK